jgi:hypothetical protein
MLRLQRTMTHLVLFRRHFVRTALAALAVLVVSASAEAQGIGFQGGGTVDPEQFFVGTHFETGNIYQGLRFRPGIDGGWGGDYSLATINLEFTYNTPLGRSAWSIYQGFGPAIVLVRQDTNTDVHAGTFFTFGFGHRSGFFTEFKYGGGSYPTLKFGAGFTVRKRQP